MFLSKLKRIPQKGFTLIELLIVMAILGVLSIGLVAAINPTEKINAANDSRVITDIGVQARASESYATARGGFYPSGPGDLTTSSELKFAPTPATGYAYNWIVPASCSAGGGVNCTGIVIWTVLKGAKYTGGSTPLPLWKYESSSGKSCGLGPAVTPVIGTQC